MFYRITTTIQPWAVKIDNEGNNLASPARIEQLAAMGLPNTPPLLDHINPDGTYVIYRDFDTQEQADIWDAHYTNSGRSDLVGSTVWTEVETKQVGTYTDSYLALTDEEKIALWNSTPSKAD